MLTSLSLRVTCADMCLGKILGGTVVPTRDLRRGTRDPIIWVWCLAISLFTITLGLACIFGSAKPGFLITATLYLPPKKRATEETKACDSIQRVSLRLYSTWDQCGSLRLGILWSLILLFLLRSGLRVIEGMSATSDFMVVRRPRKVTDSP